MRTEGTGTVEIRYGFGVSQGGVNHQDQVSSISKSRSQLGELTGCAPGVSGSGYRRRMALDDAIDKARQEADHRQAQEWEREEREQRTQQRLLALGAESAKRLAPYVGRESLHILRQSAVGSVRGANGQRYQQVMAQWCWYLRDLGWRDAHRQPVPTVLLLLQDGRFARVRLDWPRRGGKYVTTVNVHLPEATDFPGDTIDAYFWDTWLEELEKDVATVLVRCERGE